MGRTMSAEIISVGTELLLGNVANTDARDISEMITPLGINVYYHTVVGDNPDRLRIVLEIAKRRSDIIITTGGLGPTCDDLTKQTVAAAFGLDLYFDEDEAERIRSFFSKRLHGSPMTENNMQQAMLPQGCTVLRNEWGTAPGCAFHAEDTYVLMLPGPPRECIEMFKNCAVPYLRRFSDSEIVSVNIHVFGEGESVVEDKLRDMMNGMSNPTLAPYAKEGEVMLRVTAKAETHEKARVLIAPVIEDVRRVLGDIVYGIDTKSLEETVFMMLSDQNKTLAIAESCTGGMLSKRITDIPGASSVYIGGVAAYQNHSKTVLLDIPEDLITTHGVVSYEVAAEMAQGIRSKLVADFGLGITGYAGPDASGAQEVGMVYVALAAHDGVFMRKLYLGQGRERIRTAASNHALDMLRRYLCGLPVAEHRMRDSLK